MAENSNIEWTHHTFNPWIGCQKVGPGCDHCYAEAWDARRLQQQETRWGAHAVRTRTSAANWRKPLAWDRAAAAAGERHRVFCASLADVFDNHASILPEWRADLWALIRATSNLDWMLLTKRPGNIANMLPVPFDFEKQYPNVWLGCTVVNQAEADRDLPKLKAVPARERFLSIEPLLEEILFDPCDLTFIDLVIVGGESGPGARPMHPDWARSLRDQCVLAGVAFHFKQWGEWGPIRTSGHNDPRYPADPPPSEHMERFGKKAAGRLLDGQTWDQMPNTLNTKEICPLMADVMKAMITADLDFSDCSIAVAVAALGEAQG